MKRLVSIVVVAGMVACIPAAFAQQNHFTAQRPPITSPAAQPRFNLNGIWEGTAPGGVLTRLQVRQSGDTFASSILFPNSQELPVFNGRYTGGFVITGKRLIAQATPGHPAQWRDARLVIDDPDHFHADGMPTIERKTPPLATDAVCDSVNSSHTQGEFAAMRGEDAGKHNDFPMAACWFHTGALENNPRAEADYAWLLESGKSGTKNFTQALVWGRKAAAQHDSFAALLLQQMYAKGEGVPTNLQLASYWHNQAQQDLVTAQRQRLADTQQARSTAPQQNPGQAAQNNPQQQLTQSQAEGLAILVAILVADGGSSQTSPADAQQGEDEDRRRRQIEEEEKEEKQREACGMNGGTVSPGIFSGFTCQ
jgi:hypothetical protein